jgi:hypothetical protein
MEAPDLMGGRWFGVIVVLAAAICCAGVIFGAWWVTFLAGAALGAVIPARLAMPAASLAGLLAWGVLLAWEQWRYGLGPTAHSLAAIMGFTQLGPAVPIVLTCLVGLLLGLTGAWAGVATRSVLFSGQSASSR